MTIKEEILALFKILTDSEKQVLLQELNSGEVGETILLEGAPVVSCPHCDSKLFVKNGTRGGLQKYRCKSCCKIFTSRTGTALHRIQKVEKFDFYKDSIKIQASGLSVSMILFFSFSASANVV